MAVREYFVLDGEGFVSSDHGEMESFTKLDEAKERARVLAKSEPGKTVVIAQAITYITCEIAKVTMRERRLRA